MEEKQEKKEEEKKEGEKKKKKKDYTLVLSKQVVSSAFMIIIRVLSNKYLLIEEKMEVEEQAMRIIRKLQFLTRKASTHQNLVESNLIFSLIMLNMKEKSEYQNLISSLIDRVYLLKYKDTKKEQAKAGSGEEEEKKLLSVSYNSFRTFFKSVSEIDKETFINVLSDICELRG
mmetsp:Transcript_44384/g.32438  ORF Transcript_44384/g.32438 Transcript_44384/m.32438 type:complete len:173 (+) Transcript_44384:1140-1658(+)